VEQRISMITLAVEDLAASRRFYEDGLGWQAAGSSNDDIAFYAIAGMVLGLYPRAELSRETGVDIAAGPGAITLAFNARSRDEVDSVISQAVEAGAKSIKAAEEAFWGGYSGYIADPDGHLIEIAHNPFWSIDDNGHIALE